MASQAKAAAVADLGADVVLGRDESFGVLVDAQAMGDFEAFGSHELPALRIDLGDDPETGLSELLAAFAEALA